MITDDGNASKSKKIKRRCKMVQDGSGARCRDVQEKFRVENLWIKKLVKAYPINEP